MAVIGFNLEADYKITNDNAYYDKVSVTFGVENNGTKILYTYDFKKLPKELRDELFDKMKPYFTEGHSEVIDY